MRFRSSSNTPVQVSGLPYVNEVAAGGDRTCALAVSGPVCWGDNSTGGLGDCTTIDRDVPTPVSGLTASAIWVGDTFT